MRCSERRQGNTTQQQCNTTQLFFRNSVCESPSGDNGTRTGLLVGCLLLSVLCGSFLYFSCVVYPLIKLFLSLQQPPMRRWMCQEKSLVHRRFSSIPMRPMPSERLFLLPPSPTLYIDKWSSKITNPCLVWTYVTLNHLSAFLLF